MLSKRCHFTTGCCQRGRCVPGNVLIPVQADGKSREHAIKRPSGRTASQAMRYERGSRGPFSPSAGNARPRALSTDLLMKVPSTLKQQTREAIHDQQLEFINANV